MMWRMVVGTTVVAVPVTITLMDMFGYVAKVEGASMQPCLNPDDDGKKKDYVVLNRWKARNFEFERGEVVSLSCPHNSDQKIIKRIIGLEGDTIKTLNYRQLYVRIPEGHCWIEGDHHGQSMDSNFFGPVSMGLINAKATSIIWPPRRWQRIQKEVPKGRINVKPKEISAHLMNIMDDIEDTHIHDEL